ncbi:MAG TPA: hypothetical protein VFX59_11365, partial [Polyangiales bacterium]|nr:hypothetical protein [Polyangiales bacterium]
MRGFLVFSLAAYFSTIAIAVLYRHRFFAVFAGIVLGIHTFSSTAIEPTLSRHGGLGVEALLWYAQLATFIYFFRIGRVQNPRGPYRVLISWPASWFSASTFLALPWAVAAVLGFTLHWVWAPLVVGLLGFGQSSWTR